jgi:membrane protein
MAASLRRAEFVQNVWREMDKDRIWGRAAELAFYLILSLFPLLICILTLLTFFHGARELAIQYLARVFPEEALTLIKNWVAELFESRSGGVLSFGLLFSLWSASTGFAALMDVLNTAYEVKEGRSFLRARATAMTLTLALTLLVVSGLALVIYGRTLIGWLLQQINIELSSAWSVLTYISGLALLYSALALTYNFAPNVDRKANRVWPGTFFGIAGILIVSYLFSLYLKFGPSYNATYGSLGAVVVLMLWLYLTGVVIIIGAEINSEMMKRAGRSAKPRIST